MNSVETLIWSAYAGAYAMMILCGVVVALHHRTPSSVQYLVYALCCFFSLIGLSGLVRVIAPNVDSEQYLAFQVAAPTTCAAIAAAGLRDWLGTRQRNRTIDRYLIGLAILNLLAGAVMTVALPVAQQLSASACVVVISVFVFASLCLWAAMLGDALATFMTLAALMLGMALIGHFGLALGLLQGTEAHAVTAVLSAVASLAISILLWQRSSKEYDAMLGDSASTQYDLTTGLYNGTAIIKIIIKAQERLQLRGATGAVLAIKVFNTASLLEQIGPAGMQQLFARVGARVRRSAGLINPVGRYFDRCFLVLIETQHSNEEYGNLMESLVSAITKPMEIKGLHGETHSVALHVGVGTASLRPQSDVSIVVDKSLRAARAAAGVDSDVPSKPAMFANSVPLR